MKLCQAHEADRHDYYSREPEREPERVREVERLREVERMRMQLLQIERAYAAEMRQRQEAAESAATEAAAQEVLRQTFGIEPSNLNQSRPRNGTGMQRRNAISGPSSGPNGPR